LISKRRLNSELDEELQFHLAARTRDNIDAGMSPDVARQDAMRQFGNWTLAKELAREANTFARFESVVQDVAYAVRSLWKNPGFTAVAVLTLALGVGANTAIFSVVYESLLKPLPYANPGEIVSMSFQIPQLRSQFPTLPVRAADFEDFRRSNRVFSGMAAIRERDFNLTGQGDPERVYGARVSANLFSLLGVQPQLGRAFLPAEDAPGRDAVVLISHDFWVRRFGANREIVNRTISLDGQPHLVVGVMPAGFLFPVAKQLHPMVELGPRIDVWKPAAFTQTDLAPVLNRFSWGVVARLQPGMSLPAAQGNLDAIAQEIGRQLRATNPRLTRMDLRTQIVSIRDVFTGNVHQPLVMIMAAVGLLLVIACVNLVNLLIARLSSRSREMATRAALGASRSRIVWQVLTESMVIAALGGLAGLPLAVWGTRLLLLIGPADLSLGQSLQFSAPVFLFALGIVFLSGLAVGTLPAIQMTHRDLHARLTEGARGTSTGRRSGGLRRMLVAAEVSLCTGLLVIAVLLLRSFVNVMGVDKGFAVERVLSVELALSPEQYGGSQSLAFYGELLDGMRTLPGVVAAGGINILPLTPESEGEVQGVYLETDTERRLDRPIAQYRIVTPGYFAAMRIPIAAGRLFDAQESASAVIASEELVRLLWPGAAPSDVIGRRVRIGEPSDDPVPIVGVVGDVRAASLDRRPTPAIYVPHARNRARAMSIVLRTAQDPESLISAVRNEVRKRDGSVPVPTLRTMREIVSASLTARRFQMAMILLFAALALGLALVGVYGVTSYSVARQTREIGVRIAIGAQPSEVLRSVLVKGLRPVGLGLLIGLVAAAGAAFSIRSLLYGIVPLDPVALGTVSGALLLTATIACYIPARRAARVDPTVALRAE
jgi:predicted permease